MWSRTEGKLFCKKVSPRAPLQKTLNNGSFQLITISNRDPKLTGSLSSDESFGMVRSNDASRQKHGYIWTGSARRLGSVHLVATGLRAGRRAYEAKQR